MDELQVILAKYKRDYLAQLLASPETDQLALAFYEDVAEILDIISRMKNVERNPTGFSIDDAPILGLLVRTWKLLKLVVLIYKEDSAEYAVIAERALIEVAVTATYLLRSGASTMEDYRRCSYRNRFKIARRYVVRRAGFGVEDLQPSPHLVCASCLHFWVAARAEASPQITMRSISSTVTVSAVRS